MSKLDVTLINAQNGEAWPAEVIVDQPVGTWVDQLLEALELPREQDGRLVHYCFVIERNGQIVNENKTLEFYGVRQGDTLRLERASKQQYLYIDATPQSTENRSIFANMNAWGAAFFLALGWVIATLIAWGVYTLSFPYYSIDNLEELAYPWLEMTLFFSLLGLFGGVVTAKMLQWRIKQIERWHMIAIICSWLLAGGQLAIFRDVNYFRLVAFGLMGGFATAFILKWPLPSLSGKRALWIGLGWLFGWLFSVLLMIAVDWDTDIGFLFPILLIGTWIGSGIMLRQIDITLRR